MAMVTWRQERGVVMQQAWLSDGPASSPVPIADPLRRLSCRLTRLRCHSLAEGDAVEGRLRGKGRWGLAAVGKG